MNPLLALLVPQAAAPLDAAASPNGVNGNLVNGALSTATGGASVQVDSSAFLDILTATNQISSGAAQELTQIADSQVYKDPLAELVALMNKSQSRETGSANTDIQILPQDGSGVNAAFTAPTSSSASSIETVTDIVKGEEGGTSPVTATPDPTTMNSVNSAYTKLPSSASQQNNPDLNSKIVRPNSTSTTAATNLQAAATNHQAAATITTIGTKDTGKTLNSSSKLLDTFEGVTNPQPPANADAIDTRGTLADAAKAYIQFDGKQASSTQVQTEFVDTTNISPGSSSAGNNMDVSLNNVTPIETPKITEYSELTATPKKAPASYPNPAEQASIKIANAINDGVRHISIQLEPAKLGHMEVRMELAEEGTSRLIVFVEKHETLNLLQKDVGTLERVLQDAGFKTDSGSLSLNLKGGDEPGLASSGEGGSKGEQQNGDELASNDNVQEGIEYQLDLSNGVIDITV